MADQNAQSMPGPVSKPLVINPNYAIFTLAIVVLSLVNFALLWLPLTSEQRNVIVLMELLITIYLLCDAFYQLLRQPDRRRFLWRRYGWLIFLGSLPFPLLRVARLAYAIAVYRRLRRSDYVALGRVVIARRAQSTLLFAVLAALIVLEVSSLLILGAESASPDRNIKTAFDAVWWNIVTMGTVGYGDRYPVTTLGRIIGIVVIITGVGLFSGITSFLAQWFLKPRVADDAAADKGVVAQVQALRDELAQRDREYRHSLEELKTQIATLSRSEADV